MYNLKENNGTFKGIIGECLFKDTNENVILTKFFNKNKFINLFQKQINAEKLNFLINNWYSIDALELDKVNRIIILYEIKTKNKYNNKLDLYKPKMTLATHKLYNKAKELGFSVKLAIVLLLKDWNYEIKIENFDSINYCIDKPKIYDKSERQ